jgi:hypothetical protein
MAEDRHAHPTARGRSLTVGGLLAVGAIATLALATGAPAAAAPADAQVATPTPLRLTLATPTPFRATTTTTTTTGTAPRAGEIPTELALPLLVGGAAALGGGLYLLRRKPGPAEDLRS